MIPGTVLTGDRLEIGMKIRVASLTVMVLALLSTTLASAETLVLSSADTRLVLAFQVPTSAVQSALPADWQPAPPPSGPSTGANVLLVFLDGQSQFDGQGKPTAGGMNRFVVAAIPASNPKSGAAGIMIAGGFAAHPDGAPGAYKNYSVAQITHERKVRTDGQAPGNAEESWQVRDSAGGALTLRVAYERTNPARVKVEQKIYSAVEPTFFRIYRVEQGVDMLKSTATGTDRVSNYEFRSTLGAFAKLFDGNEKLVSITSIPWYVRQVFVP
jgi:hypothetical protein